MQRDNRTGASSPSSVERPRGRLTRREHLDRYSSTARPATALPHRQPRRIPRAWPVHQQRGEIRRHELPADPSLQTPHTQHHIGRRAGGCPQLIMDRVQLPPARVPAAAQEPAAPRDPFRGASALGARSQTDKSDPGDADPALWILPGGIADGGQGSRCRRGRQCSPVGRKRLGVRTAELEPKFSVVSAFLHMRLYPQMRCVAPRRPQWVGGALVRQQHRGRNAVARRGVLSPRLTTSPRPARRRMYLQPCKPS